MKTKTCPPPCSTKYEYTAEDLKFSSSNTNCPKCKSTLEAQWHQSLVNKIMSNGEKIFDSSDKFIGWNLNSDFLFADKNTITIFYN